MAMKFLWNLNQDNWTFVFYGVKMVGIKFMGKLRVFLMDVVLIRVLL